MQYQFNAQQYTPQFGGGGGLPTGRHKVIIEKTGDQEVNGKPGHHMLVLTLKAVEGPAAGKTQDMRLNLIFPSDANTAEIANKQLSAVCHVVGVFGFNDTNELCNKPFFVDVSPQAKNPQYQNIDKIYDINGNEPGKAPAQQQVQTPVAPVTPPAAGFGQAQAGPAPGSWPAEGQAQPATGFGAPAATPAPGFGAPAPEAAPAGFGQQQPAAGFGQQQPAQPAPGGFGQPAGGQAAPNWGPR